MMPEHFFKNIQTVLDKVTRKYGLDHSLKEDRFFSMWEEIVGDSVAQHCNPKCIEHKILFLEVENSFWKQIITNQKKELLKLIANQFGNDFINKIKFI